VRIFKFKPKRGYKRRTGHRQELTRVRVDSIAASSGRAKKAAAQRGEAAATASEARPKDES